MAERVDLSDLVERGLYREAASVLKASPQPTLRQRVIAQFVDLHVGDPAHVVQESRALLKANLGAAERVLCQNVLGKATVMTGRLDEGCALMREALRLAASLGDLPLRARSQALLTKTLLQWVSLEAALTELPELRRMAYVAGDAQALVEFHLTLAEVEMKRGRSGAAGRSLRVALALCERFGFVFLLSRVLTLEANNALLSASPEEAFTRAQLALTQAEHSGSTLALIPALSTYAHAALLGPRLTEAEWGFRRMLEYPIAKPGLVAAYDGIMQIGALRNDLETTEKMRLCIAELATGEDIHPYYILWNQSTQIRLLLQTCRPEDALRKAREHMGAVENVKDAHLIERFRLLEAEAVASCGDSATAVRLLTNALNDVDEFNLSDATVVGRIADAISNRQTRAAGYWGEMPEETATSTLATTALVEAEAWRRAVEASNALVDLASYPRSLGQQLVLIARTIGATTATLTSRDRSGAQKVLDSFGTSTCEGDNERFLVGREGDTTFEMIYTCVNPRVQLALLAITRLVRSGVALHESRIREREQAALWVPETATEQLGMIYASNKMGELIKVTSRVAESNVTVLFTGETGTGKELFARTVHESSPRRAKPFIPFNCNAVARDMLDSQLFGYRRGAFTGAADAFPGVIRAAAGGTLFLDEIGELSLDVQPKLLRFLESGEIHPLGEPRPIPVDVRIVAATNANLEQLVADGKFREDLFYRLNVVRLQVPPLRERREEIPLLVQHFLDKFVREFNKSGLQLAEETMEYLVLYRWPGNVRQLANEIRRLVALAESGAILMPEHLSHEIAASRRTIPASERDLAPTEFVVRLDQPIAAAIEHVERAMIQHALARASGRVEDAARALGLSRKGLYLKRHRLQTAETASPPVPVHVQ